MVRFYSGDSQYADFMSTQKTPYFDVPSKIPVVELKPSSNVKIAKNEHITVDGENESVKLFKETELLYDGKLELVSENGVRMFVMKQNDNLIMCNQYIESANQEFQVLNNPVSTRNNDLVPVLKSIPVSSTIGSMKNMTYDIRAEPPCPKTVVSPFLNSSIMPPFLNSSTTPQQSVLKATVPPLNVQKVDTNKTNAAQWLNLDRFDTTNGTESETDDDEATDDYVNTPANTPTVVSNKSNKISKNYFVKNIIINFKGIPIASNNESEVKLAVTNNLNLIIEKGTTVFMELTKNEWCEVVIKENLKCKLSIE